MENKTIDIYSTGEYPANVLSNFYENNFVFDGVHCASMEGFIQSLKTKNVKLQQKVCSLSGKEAKLFFDKKIQNLRWKLTGKLYWKGKPINRTSDEYQIFLDKAYKALSGNEVFLKALIDSENATLIHSVGKTDTRKTVLTEYELISRLNKCRESAKNKNKGV